MRRPGTRLVRAGETLYAAVALLLWLGLPFPPRRPELAPWLDLSITAVAAAVLAWRASALSRRGWWAAAVLSAWVLVPGLFTLGRVLGSAGSLGPGQLPSYAIASLTFVAQLLVAMGLYWSRALRTDASPGATVAAS